MQINYDYEWINIPEGEYKEDNNYRKDPIYGGLQNLINDTPIGYKYYKRGKFQANLICSEQEWQRLKCAKNVKKLLK